MTDEALKELFTKLTAEEIKELVEAITTLSAKWKALDEYTKNCPVIIEANQRSKLRDTTKDAKKATHLIYQDLSRLEMTGITMSPISVSQNELIMVAQRLRQVADKLTVSAWHQ